MIIKPWQNQMKTEELMQCQASSSFYPHVCQIELIMEHSAALYYIKWLCFGKLNMCYIGTWHLLGYGLKKVRDMM